MFPDQEVLCNSELIIIMSFNYIKPTGILIFVMKFYWSVGGSFHTLENIEFLVSPSCMNRASMSAGREIKPHALVVLRTICVCTLCSMSVDLRLPKECRKYVNHLHDNLL